LPVTLAAAETRQVLEGSVMQTTLWSHETVLPAGAISASQAREFVRFHLQEHHLPHLVEDVRLVVSELATNAVTHAGTPFTVVLLADAHRVLLTVQDGSPSPPFQVATQALDMGGRGLFIVNMVSRQWGVEIRPDGIKSVWAAFDTSPAVEGTAG
jgi:anti-sigma regulatory factor (Ser/Thr protein kinase)